MLNNQRLCTGIDLMTVVNGDEIESDTGRIYVVQNIVSESYSTNKQKGRWGIQQGGLHWGLRKEYES